MKIVIAEGKTKADFLIGSLLKKKHSLMVINEDRAFCDYLAQTHKIPILHGDSSKIYTLSDAKIENYDILIALSAYDSDNLAICQAAKRLFHIKKTVAVVSNPKNVDVFKTLGVNTAISATYLLTQIIEQASTVDILLHTISIEHNKLVLTELLIDKHCPYQYRQLQEIPLPDRALICCVLRGNDMLPPQNELLLLPNDKLIFLSSPSAQDTIIATMAGRKTR